MKLPQLRAIATSANVTLSQSQGYGGGSVPCGPEQGFLWMLRRVMVASNSIGDSARFYLYSGSDVTLFDGGHLLEGYNPAAYPPGPSTPAVPATTVNQQNVNAYPVTVVITGGAITAVIVNGLTVGTGAGTYVVPSAGTISITYTVAPTWAWTNANTAITGGGFINVGYYPGTDATWLFPGEQVYAQINGATVGNQYVLSGIAVEVAAERVGALVG